jgi:hypothetical protein
VIFKYGPRDHRYQNKELTIVQNFETDDQYNAADLQNIVCFRTLFKTKRFHQERLRYGCLIPNIANGDLSLLEEALIISPTDSPVCDLTFNF